MSLCRDCRNPVRWATTVNGYRKPFDMDPDPDRGEWLLHYEEARYRDGEIVPERWTAQWVSAEFRARATDLHVAHATTCQPIAVRGAA